MYWQCSQSRLYSNFCLSLGTHAYLSMPIYQYSISDIWVCLLGCHPIYIHHVSSSVINIYAHISVFLLYVQYIFISLKTFAFKIKSMWDERCMSTYFGLCLDYQSQHTFKMKSTQLRRWCMSAYFGYDKDILGWYKSTYFQN